MDSSWSSKTGNNWHARTWGHGERGHQSLCQGLRLEGSWRGAVLRGGHNGDGEEPEGSTKALVEDVIR